LAYCHFQQLRPPDQYGFLKRLRFFAQHCLPNEDQAAQGKVADSAKSRFGTRVK